MSKRFGRNQKRRARERISELERLLLEQSTWYAYVPHDEDDRLDMLNVIEYEETERSGRYQMIELEASLEVDARTCNAERLKELHYDGKPVAFRGKRFMLTAAEYDMSRDTFRLELKGVSG